MHPFTLGYEMTTEQLLEDLIRDAGGGWFRPDLYQRFLGSPPDQQRRALDSALDRGVRRAVAHGWCPLDLAEIARRKAAGAEVFALDVLARQAAEHPQARVHPRWLQQIDQCRPAQPQSATPPWPERAESVVRLLAALHGLPTEPAVLPAPGSADPAARSTGAVNESVLRRVRALLAKAESTEFPAEAEALSAKAHTLMREHAIDRAMADTRYAAPAAAAARRIWLDNPYLPAKSRLVSEVARANRCRSVFFKALGVATVLGFDDDLDTVELLVTSLMLQAERSMRLAGTHDTDGATRSRSFRQSFLLAYASRIGERLRESSSTIEAEVDARYDGALLPVLAGREQAVENAVAVAFPLLAKRTIRVGSSAGWGAGRAAADLARLDVCAALRGQA